MSAGPLPDAGTRLVLPAHQTYTDGTVVDWVDVAEEGGEEPAHPAPELTTTERRRSPTDAVVEQAAASPRPPRRRRSPTPSPASSAGSVSPSAPRPSWSCCWVAAVAVTHDPAPRRARRAHARPGGRRPRRARGAGAQRAAEHRPGGRLDRPRASRRWSRSRSTSPCCSSAPRSWSTRPTRRWSTSGRRSSSTTPPRIAVTGELPAGEYTVIYRVTSADGHPIEGAVPVHRGGGDLVRGRDGRADDDALADDLRRGPGERVGRAEPVAVRPLGPRRGGSRLRRRPRRDRRRARRGRRRRRVAAAAAAPDRGRRRTRPRIRRRDGVAGVVSGRAPRRPASAAPRRGSTSRPPRRRHGT